MSFPLYYLLFIYLALIFIWLFFCVVALYHMLKYGYKTVSTYLATAIFLIISASMLIASCYYILGIDWSRQVTILEIFFDKL